MKPLHYAASLAALVLLTACGGEPSNDDIKSAVDRQIREVNERVKNMANAMGAQEQAAQMFDSMPTMKVEKVEKIGCKKDGAAYVCDVSIALTAPMIGTTTQTTALRMVKTDAGWTVAGGM